MAAHTAAPQQDLDAVRRFSRFYTRRLGLLERRSRNVELGESYMVKAHEIYERYSDEHRQNFAGFLSDRALVLNDLERYDEAIALNQRAIGIFEELVGPDSPRVAGSLLNLADQQRRAGRRSRG